MFILAFVSFVHPAFCQSIDCDTLEKCQAAVKANPKSSLAHYRMAEIFFSMQNSSECSLKSLSDCNYYISSLNEFREALNGDHDPEWIVVWSHINMGKIYDLTSQRERALK